MNKRFRINDLTVAVGNVIDQNNFACGLNFSCPGGPVGSFCNQLTPPVCIGGFTNNCLFTRNCGFTIDCGVTRGGCGLNFSTLQPRDIAQLVQTGDPVQQVEIISALKEDLATVIEELENVEKQAASTAVPQTLDEASALEKQLEGALSEVKQMKKNLK